MGPEEREEQCRRLVIEHDQMVRAFFLRRVSDHTAADDLTSETFAIAWRRLDQLPTDPEYVRRWLYRIAHNVMSNWARGRRRRRSLFEKLAAEPSVATEIDLRDPPQALDEQLVGEALGRAFVALSHSDRDVILLAAWEGLTGEALAEVLGCSPTAAWSRLSRARKRLRREWLRNLEPLTEGITP